MIYGKPHHQEVIVVRNEVFAATLFTQDHHAMMIHRNAETGEFFCIFAISNRLRADVKSYYGSGPNVNTLRLKEELDTIDMYIAEDAIEVARHVT